MEKLEINVNGQWVEVNEWIFRSWSGPRRIDNNDYAGTVFYLGSHDEVQPAKPRTAAEWKQRIGDIVASRSNKRR